MRGGLGNQMFQYAYAKKLEKKGHHVKIDSSFKRNGVGGEYQLDKYNIDLISSTNKENKHYRSLVPKILRKISFYQSRVVKEKNLLFNDDYLNVEDDNFIIGFFVSEKYFKDIRSTLIRQFTIKKEVSAYTKDMELKILKSKNSCSIHIRRGDYLSDRYIKTHNVCGLEYYHKAIKHIQNEDKNLNFFIFSDDIEWAKENLKIKNATYIGGKDTHAELYGKNQENLIPPHEDIYLMSLCSHNIVANSTFSWWGAWLNENKDKIVVAPKYWFLGDELQAISKDMFCADWVRM